MEYENPKILGSWKMRIGEFSFCGNRESENSRFVGIDNRRILVLWKTRVRKISEGTHAPPTAQMPHPPRRQRRQGAATDHQVPEVPPQYGIPLPPDVRVYHPGTPRQGPPPPHPTSPGHHHPGNRRLCSATTATHANHRQNHPGEPHLRLSPHSNRPPTHTQRHRHHLLH